MKTLFNTKCMNAFELEMQIMRFKNRAIKYEKYTFVYIENSHFYICKSNNLF